MAWGTQRPSRKHRAVWRISEPLRTGTHHEELSKWGKKRKEWSEEEVVEEDNEKIETMKKSWQQLVRTLEQQFGLPVSTGIQTSRITCNE